MSAWLGLLTSVATTVALWSGPAHAEWARFAVVAGNNRGVAREAALRYAEGDARKVAAVLTGPGDVAPARLKLLTGEDAAAFWAALDDQEQAIAAAADAGQQTMLVVYFSGHADGLNLQLGSDLLAFSELRGRVSRSRASLKLVVVDSCQSGALTNLKGVVPIVDVEVWLRGHASARGTVIITSASAGEFAQESRGLEGSFFTHHLVWGLRGAADFDRDKQVTLAEAYNYAYSATVDGTWKTVAGRQHPTIELDLDQRGNVSLTDLEHRDALVVFGADVSGDFAIVDPIRAEVLAEVKKPLGPTQDLAVAAGEYWIVERRGPRLFVQAARVAHGGRVDVSPGEMIDYTATIEGIRKDGAGSGRGRWQVVAGYGLTSGTLGKTSALHRAVLGARVDVGPVSIFPRALYGDTWGYGDLPTDNIRRFSVRSIGVEVMVAYRWEVSRVDLFAGAQLGLAYATQTLIEGDPQLDRQERSGLIGSFGVVGGLDLPIHAGWSAQVFWAIDELVYELDGTRDLSASVAVGGTLGLAYRF